MTKILAALDNSVAAGPVVATALALRPLLGADVEALHVAVDGDRVASSAAGVSRVEYRTVHGDVIEQLLEAADTEEVAAVVVGARGTPAGRRPLGSTALAVATSLAKPVFVVPPDVRRPGSLRRVLVPMEGEGAGSYTPEVVVELARGAEIDVSVVHVYDEASVPAFTDQPQHEHEAWAREFLRRYCPWGIGSVRVLARVGRVEDVLPLVVEEIRPDVVAMAWAQELTGERAPIVRSILARARTTVMLTPVRVLGAVGEM